MPWHSPAPDELRRILARTVSVTVVGVSADPQRPSHSVARYLRSATGYRLHLVNPTLDALFGQPVYPSLAELPEPPDLVTVFRRHEHLPGVAEQSVAAGANTLWLQLGLWHEPVAGRAAAAGLTVVMDRCVRIEHERLLGGPTPRG